MSIWPSEKGVAWVERLFNTAKAPVENPAGRTANVDEDAERALRRGGGQ